MTSEVSNASLSYDKKIGYAVTFTFYKKKNKKKTNKKKNQAHFSETKCNFNSGR